MRASCAVDIHDLVAGDVHRVANLASLASLASKSILV